MGLQRISATLHRLLDARRAIHDRIPDVRRQNASRRVSVFECGVTSC